MSAFGSIYVRKRVLVTGAGKGFTDAIDLARNVGIRVGRAVVVQIHENGAIVDALSRTQADLDSLQEECPNIIPIVVDVGDWDTTREILESILTAPVDVLINNAGIGWPERFMDISPSTFDTLFGVNVKAIVNISQVCASKMIEAGTGGTIINISSMLALRPSVGNPLYSASKAAVDSLTKSMARELGEHKINVVAMNLGNVETNMIHKALPNEESMAKFIDKVKKEISLGEVFVPMDQIVNSILFVGSGMVGMMTGSGFVLDGGYSAN